ncbi:NAC domain-containing protein 90-like [Camellia sinensis]|uniref:NAC domain-containing protein 90-like n=1 Tax=Camellia sinensis TaxID=4442 RepID=UPI00103675B0|nr:NAC domain-containing protein 90-like [Camellia sinensis]
MVEIPPGYRFYPTEEELVSFYLHNKLEGNRPDLNRAIPVVNIYEHEPWHLPKVSGELCRGDTEQWFFFTPRQEREARGGRPNRTTATGYWKATGSPSYVYSSDNREIGVKKTMVFYKGKSPTGKKTKWKMHEYRAIEAEAPSPFGSAVPKKLRHEISLCRVYVVSGSFRAFDRRPLGAETSQTTSQQVHGNGAMTLAPSQATKTPSQATKTMESTSSPESSYSGEDPFELPRANLGTVGGQEPLWEWEQLNWL